VTVVQFIVDGGESLTPSLLLHSITLSLPLLITPHYIPYKNPTTNTLNWTTEMTEILSHHHEKLMEAYHVHMERWQRLISPVTSPVLKQTGSGDTVNTENGGVNGGKREHGRCPNCWLRTYDCYCERKMSELEERRRYYEEGLGGTVSE
jgi:hypothetical protein